MEQETWDVEPAHALQLYPSYVAFNTTLVCGGELKSQQLGPNFVISSMRENGFSFPNLTSLISTFAAGAIQCLFRQRRPCVLLF